MEDNISNIITPDILEIIPDALIIVNQVGEIVYVNKQAENMFGYKKKELLGKTVEYLIPKSYRKRHIQERKQYIKHPKIRRMGSNLALFGLKKNGCKFAVDINITPLKTPNEMCVLAAIRDITKQKKIQANLTYLAKHDSLTNLLNRDSFEERLEQLIKAGNSKMLRLAILFIDVNKFKPINDNFGHKVGDKVLQAIANRFKTCVRRTDIIARIGGDEFVVALQNIETDQDAIKIAQKIIAIFEDPLHIKREVFQISVSIGIARFKYGDNIDSSLKKADIAMYQAKIEGGCRYHLYNEDK